MAHPSDLMFWAPTRKIGGGWICHKDSPSPPPAPDYTGAAQATASGNLDSARATAAANRVNQITPYGNLSYSQNGTDTYGNPTWTATQTLSDAQQGILNSTNALNQGLMNTANSGLNYANSVLGQPGVTGWNVSMPGNFQAGNPTTGINPGQSYQDAMMARLQPQIDRENQQSDAQLANQGITQGSQAYDTAKTLLGQQHNDLLNNATVQGMGMGLNANQQAFSQNQAQYQSGLGATQQGFQQAAYNQMQPINVINALRTGSQVTAPTYAQSAQQQYTPGADYSGAAQAGYNGAMNAYNTQVGSQNSMQSGLMSMGGMALLKYSDRRTKRNIRRIATLDNGLPLYTFEYLPEFQAEGGAGQHVGVMADEVEKLIPAAVHTGADGIKRVNYALIGGM